MKHGAAPTQTAMPTTKPRISINLSESEYAELSALAARYNLSMAWIGHKAIFNFLEQNRVESLQLPLTFAKQPEKSPWLKNERQEWTTRKA
jgi:hypothetical protein